MEMIGAGLYKGLAKQYKTRNNNLSQKFIKFSNQEAMHGHLFERYSKEKFNKKFISGFFWKWLGQFMALIMRFVPLNKKLMKLQAAEQNAVVRIEKTLTENIDAEYHKILIKILPHEKDHAGLYSEVFGN